MGKLPKKSVLKRTSSNRKGFTLVELLVSASIILLCIIAIVAMLRKGREIDINDRYRRNARAHVVSTLEGPQFKYTKYTDLLNNPGTTTSTVVIDTLPDGNVLTGTLTTNVGGEITATAEDGINVPYIPVTVGIVWQTMEGNDNITITKFISNVGSGG
jgi:hypothetical protein